VSANRIELLTSFLPARRTKWALIESNYRPLSYQESVLATELNALLLRQARSGKRSPPATLRVAIAGW
jgi:hypothetical protein